MALTNPASHFRRSQLWGFEVSHILGAFGAMTIANFTCTTFALPLWISWVAGLTTLLVLRLCSIGKKAGHLGFVFQWLSEPHLYLGFRKPNRGAA